MESWITWIIQVVAYGIICFLLKRELNQFDQRDKRLQERIDEVEKKAATDTKALAEKMDNNLSSMTWIIQPVVYPSICITPFTSSLVLRLYVVFLLLSALLQLHQCWEKRKNRMGQGQAPCPMRETLYCFSFGSSYWMVTSIV